MREMRRSRQLLGEAETLEILDRGSHGVLALIGDGGYPYALPISYAREGDRLYMHCAKAGHKLDALRAASDEELAEKLELTSARIADLRAAVNFLSPVVEGEAEAEEKAESGEE